MHSTLSFVRVTLASLAFAAASRWEQVKWVARMTAGTTGQQEVQPICDFMRTTLMPSERSAIDMGQVGLLITESGLFSVSE